MSDRSVITPRSNCEKHICSKCRGMLVVVVVVVLSWPVQELSTLLDIDSHCHCSFTLLCLQWLTFYLCLCHGPLTPGSFLALWPVPEHEQNQTPFTLPRSTKRQVDCMHILLELEGPGHTQLFFLPHFPQFINLQSSVILQTCHHPLLSISIANTLGQATLHFHWQY